MSGTLVDSNIIIDILTDDPKWCSWSLQQLTQLGQQQELIINPIVYAETSVSFQTIEEHEKIVTQAGFTYAEIPKEALFLAAKVFVNYKKRRGNKASVLPDFYIGAHAAIKQLPILTRDSKRYQTYFPSVPLITPDHQSLQG